MAQKSRFKLVRTDNSDGRAFYGISNDGVIIQTGWRKDMIAVLQALRAEEKNAHAAARVDVYYSTEKGWIAEAVTAGQIVKWGGGFGSPDHALKWANANNLAPRAMVYGKRGGLPKAIDLTA